MNPNLIKLAATVTAVAAATRFGPKPSKKITPEQLRVDLDELTNSALAQNKRAIQQNLELSKTADALLAQNRFLIQLLEKYNVQLDEFDRIALANLFS